MDKRGCLGFVEFTIEIPIEVAEHLTQHGQNFIDGLQRAVIRYNRNSSVDPSINEKTYEPLAKLSE